METLRDHLEELEVLETASDRGFLFRRQGPRPRTPLSIPHLQMNQWPPENLVDRLLECSLHLEHVRPKESRMATRGSCALWLPDSYAGGPPDAFIDQNEFCHLHPVPEGSVHLTLPAPLRERAIELGWAEQHSAVRSGAMRETLVTVYAPRDGNELSAVFRLIRFSWRFARGIPAPQS